MKFKSQVYTEVSGSIGGITYAHNSGGMYARARATPTDPQTARQVAVRNAMAALTAQWNDLLTSGERAAWALYAANTLLTNAFGDPITVSGQNMYIRSNVARVQAGLDEVASGPTIFNKGNQAPPPLTGVSEATQLFTLGAFPGTPPSWTAEDGAAMLVYTGRPVNSGRTFYKGPFRLAATLPGDSGTPITFPQTVSSQYAATAGQNIFARLVLTRADGRLSDSIVVSATVGA